MLRPPEPEFGSRKSLHDFVVGLDLVIGTALLSLAFAGLRGALRRALTGCFRTGSALTPSALSLLVELARDLVPDLGERLARGADFLRVVPLHRPLQSLDRAVQAGLRFGVDLLAHLLDVLLRLVDELLATVLDLDRLAALLVLVRVRFG